MNTAHGDFPDEKTLGRNINTLLTDSDDLIQFDPDNDGSSDLAIRINRINARDAVKRYLLSKGIKSVWQINERTPRGTSYMSKRDADSFLREDASRISDGVEYSVSPIVSTVLGWTAQAGLGYTAAEITDSTAVGIFASGGSIPGAIGAYFGGGDDE